MRRAEREVTDPKVLLQMIEACRVCRLGLADQQGIYIVPMNFGYEYEEGKLTLYFHSAKEGRKISAIAASPQVGFEMDGNHQLITAPSACGHSYGYESIIGNGTAQIVEDIAEKKKALKLLMQHQTGEVFSITDQMANQVAVLKVEVYAFTGKRHQVG